MHLQLRDTTTTASTSTPVVKATGHNDDDDDYHDDDGEYTGLRRPERGERQTRRRYVPRRCRRRLTIILYSPGSGPATIAPRPESPLAHYPKFPPRPFKGRLAFTPNTLAPVRKHGYSRTHTGPRDYVHAQPIFHGYRVIVPLFQLLLLSILLNRYPGGYDHRRCPVELYSRTIHSEIIRS